LRPWSRAKPFIELHSLDVVSKNPDGAEGDASLLESVANRIEQRGSDAAAACPAMHDQRVDVAANRPEVESPTVAGSMARSRFRPTRSPGDALNSPIATGWRTGRRSS
jgi:hypothetical protein